LEDNKDGTAYAEFAKNGTIVYNDNAVVFDNTYKHSDLNTVTLLAGRASYDTDTSAIVYKIAAYDVKLSSQNMITLTKPQV
jgi:hypothetical protein